MNKLEESQVLPTLKELLEKFEKGDVNVYAYQIDALRQAIEQYKEHKKPIMQYFALEEWLYKKEQKDKPIEIKSAMLWGALWVVCKMGHIDWDTMLKLYGEFMSKQMNLR